jgi:hypothetical protein
VPGHCEKFYLCFQGKLITMSCANNQLMKGLLFDSKTKRCQDQSKVMCPSLSSASQFSTNPSTPAIKNNGSTCRNTKCLNGKNN